MHQLTQDLKDYATALGADLVGVADVALLKGIDSEPADLLDRYRRAVSVAVKLPDAVFEELKDGPTPLYAQVYGTANSMLDFVALRIATWIDRAGYAALPIPASQPLDMTDFRSHLSAKAVANAAGLGWQGKSLLIITPQFGPRVRLVTILTDMPLICDMPLKNRCGSCTACTEACVAQAIRNVNVDFHYESREEALDFRKCADKLVNEFKARPLVEKPICGICIKACPWGKHGEGRSQ